MFSTMSFCNLYTTICPKSFSAFCIFILTTVMKSAVFSESSEMNCSLEFQYFPSSSENSSCEMGDWGGFLTRNCCGLAFQTYLHALARRANQTGEIFLNSFEQANCLASLKESKEDVFGCGIEKLTSGGGGCSDYTVVDATDKLGDKLRSLEENCELGSSNEESDQSCGSCLRSWEDIRGKNSILTNTKSMRIETDICRFAVLVSLTSSRMGDQKYSERVYSCLGEEAIYSEDQAPSGKKNISLSSDTWILIGSLIGVSLVIIIITNILSKRCCKSSSPAKKHAFKDLQLKDSTCPKFTIKEVKAATDNLNERNFIGEGTAGKVYKGVMLNNQQVAVKHIVNDRNVETVVREVASLSHIRHPNLVALLGYCLRKEECFLVYELCPNGDLSAWLFGKDKFLSWNQRLEIAIDSARGLWFLHTFSEGCIVHRDIKPTNILLGPNFEAKLSDFGLSKVIDHGESNVSSEVRGTFGYVDPEYQSNRQVNSSGDVYSFGIVLLQILSGKKVINLNMKNPMPLNKMAKVCTRGGSTKEFADPKLNGEYSVEAFDLTLQLAMSCTALKSQRPSMEHVVGNLEKALEISTREKVSAPETTPNQISDSVKE